MKTKQKKLYNSYIYGHFEVWTFQQKCTYDKLTGIQICTSWAKMNFSQYTVEGLQELYLETTDSGGSRPLILRSKPPPLVFLKKFNSTVDCVCVPRCSFFITKKEGAAFIGVALALLRNQYTKILHPMHRRQNWDIPKIVVLIP